MDPIANFLTRIRNSYLSKHKILTIESSKIRENISKVLLKNGYILGYKVYNQDNNKKILKIALKYYDSKSVIHKIIRMSKPGLRKYCKYRNIPRVLNGLGIAIISTSKGVITDKQAKIKKIGGEVLCYVY